MIDHPPPFPFTGVHHLALVSSDMARTVHFYRDLLGMRLVKAIDLPGGLGQHFFFDMGNGDTLAFFWFAKDSPQAIVGLSSPSALPGVGNIHTAPGTMNHLALEVPLDRFEEARDRLRALGIEFTEMAHDESPSQLAKDPYDPEVWLRSVYFFDPDGHLLEIASWGRALRPEDAATGPMNARGERVALDACSPDREPAA